VTEISILLSDIPGMPVSLAELRNQAAEKQIRIETDIHRRGRTMSRKKLSIVLFLAVGAIQLQQSAVYSEEDAKRSPEEQRAITQLQKSGGLVLEVAQNDKRLDISFHLSDKPVNDQTLTPLNQLKSVYSINLRGTSITDAGLAHLKGLVELERLHLEKTKITDVGLAHLKDLTKLEYINLYGTAVTDNGIKQLASLPNLKKLYLWQTKVTGQGANALKAALPSLVIVREIDLSLPPVEAKKPEKPAEKKPAEKKKTEKKKTEKKKTEKKKTEKKPAEKKQEDKKSDDKKTEKKADKIPAGKEKPKVKK